MPECVWSDLGTVGYAAALERQRALVERRQRGEIPDQLLLLEHPHVITMGRNAKPQNLLAGEEHLRRAGVSLHATDRGGDVTYHGPGQLVGYPILDLREWKRDVVAYVRALESVLIGALGELGIAAGRAGGMTGVWAGEAKIAAIGVRVSRWVSSHGFALNYVTDLKYFQYIVPCGLAGRPVTSIAALVGADPGRERVIDAVVAHFGRVFGRHMIPAAAAEPCGIGVRE